MKKVPLIIIFALSFSFVFSQVTKQDFGILKIGCEPDYPPFCLVDENGEADGFSIDLLKASLESEGIHYEIKVDLWSKLKQELADGELDVLPLVGRTPEREPLYDFTFPYASLYGAIFTRNYDKSIQSIEDLKNKEIIVMQGDNAEEYVRRDSLSKHIILTKTFEDAFRELESGHHDAVITQRVMGLQLLNRLNIKTISPLDIPLDNFRQDFCFAVTEGDKDLLERLNEGLATVISNGTYEEIHQKWFTPMLKQHFNMRERLILLLKYLIPAIIIIGLILIILMRKEIRRKTKTLKETIEEMRQSQQLLARNEKKFKNYIDSSPIGVFVTDLKGNYLEVNKAASKITGYTREELLTMNISDFTIQSNGSAYSHFNKLVDKGALTFEKEFIKKNGETGYWRIDSVKLSNDQFLGFTTDIKDQKDTAQLLKEKNEMLQQLFDHMNNGFAYHKIITESGKPVDYIFLEFNKSFEKVMSINRKNIIGRRVTEVLKGIEKDPFNWIEVYGDVAITGNSIQFDSYSEVLKKWFSISAYSPRKGYFATVINDITKRKLVEQELEKYKNELELKVQERTKELELINEELKQYNKVFVGREFRIKKLREKVKILEEKLETLSD